MGATTSRIGGMRKKGGKVGQFFIQGVAGRGSRGRPGRKKKNRNPQLGAATTVMKERGSMWGM